MDALPPVARSLLLLALLVVAPAAIAQSNFTVEASAPSETTDYGARVDADGWVHFAVYAPEASAVTLLLYDHLDDGDAAAALPMTRNGSDWRLKVRGEGVGPGLPYLYRVEGVNELSADDQFGRGFNGNLPVNDPYATLTGPVRYSSFFASTPFTDTVAPVYAGGGKSVVYDDAADAAPGHVAIAPEDLVLYELHVQDYTAAIAGLDPELRGTYLGLAEGGLTTPGGVAAGLDHLVELGVNAVELMPVMEYDEETGNAAGRLNHWGYMTTNFFAPESRYAAVPGQQVVELKELVRALHQRGIAVFLDTVYNHTGEMGPWVADGRLAAKHYNLRGLAGDRVYRATPDGRYYWNATGTGNDVSFFGPDSTYTKRLVRDSLAHWYQSYGIDGFRFDLARILADGSGDAADWVDNDPRYAGAHLHAEPWDLGGQWWDFMDSGPWSASNNRWAKWLGRYRDKVRRFSQAALRDPRAFKQLIEGYGSVSDGYGDPASSKPWRSINLVAVHDGYTLHDCLGRNDPGGAHNCWDSNNDDNLKRERAKLLLGVLLTSQGVPLILQGDEFGRTKAAAGDDAKNSYNFESTDGDAAVNGVNWIDWSLKDGTAGAELFHWTRDLIKVRKAWHHFRRPEFAAYAQGISAGPGNDDRYSYTWEGPAVGEPSQLAVVWWGRAGEPDLMVIYNESWAPFTVTNLGDWSQGDWLVLARSWFGDDADTCEPAQWESCPEAGGSIEVKGRSMAILVSDND